MRPALTRGRSVASRLHELLAPRPGCLLLLHAAAGYGKTTALAATQSHDWLWYNLDRGDASPVTLASRICLALGVEPPHSELPFMGEPVAADLANRLEGRTLTITFDRYQHLGDAPEVGRMLGELLVLMPGLSLRIATRTRPALPLERLRLDDRLLEVGPGELRLDREEIAAVMAEALHRPPRAAELDYADTVLCGWPAALQLWLAGLEGGTDLNAPLEPGRPLHDYLHEELLVGTLASEPMDRLRSELAWLANEGPLLQRASTQEKRRVIDILVRDRVGVMPGHQGWCLHPIVGQFLAMHVRTRQSRRDEPAPRPEADDDAEPGRDERRVSIRALGGLVVEVDGLAVPEAAWPTAARRLLELLMCMPEHQATAQQAARLLWPRHLLRSALNSFNVALHGLRRVLEPDLTAGAESRYVVRLGRMYRLRVEELDCDALEFARLTRQAARPLDAEGARLLESAIDLYRGDFLATSTEEFVHEKRSRLRWVVLESLERLGEWNTADARQHQALRAYTRLLELAPHREDAWARLLELHLAAGDEYRALAALQQCEQSLEAAGIEPSGLLRELRCRIRRTTAPIERRYGT